MSHTQDMVLGLLAKNPDGMKQGDIAKSLGMHYMTVSGSLHGLKRAHLVSSWKEGIFQVWRKS